MLSHPPSSLVPGPAPSGIRCRTVTSTVSVRRSGEARWFRRVHVCWAGGAEEGERGLQHGGEASDHVAS